MLSYIIDIAKIQKLERTKSGNNETRLEGSFPSIDLTQTCSNIPLYNICKIFLNVYVTENSRGN